MRIPVEHGRRLRVHEGFTKRAVGRGRGADKREPRQHRAGLRVWAVELVPANKLQPTPHHTEISQPDPLEGRGLGKGVKTLTDRPISQSEDTPELRRRAAVALAPFGFYDSVKGEMIDAYLEAPDGVDAVIRDALDSAARGKLTKPPAAVIISGIRRGDHLRAERLPEPGLRKTGWREVYGDAHQAMTYVQDPEGTAQPPKDYDFLTKTEHVPGKWRNAETEVEKQARKTQEQEVA